MSVLFVLPGVLILPTSTGFFLTFFLLIISLLAPGHNKAIEKKELAFIYILLLLSILAFAPAIIIGTDEAERFLIRALVATFIFLTLFIMVHKSNFSGFVSHLRGVVFFSTLNSIVVIITALSPQIYDLLMIDAFSGSEKSASFLRSPGLLQGYDAAGFTAVIGLISLLMLSTIRPIPALILFTCYLSLLLSTALSSRTSLAMFSVYSLLWLAGNKVKKYRPRPQNSFNFFMVLCGLTFGSISIVLMIGVWDADLVERYSFGTLTPEFLSTIYNIGDLNDYQSHFNFSSLTMFPDSRIEFLPDNSYLRIGISAGIWGMIVSTSSFIFIALFSRASKSGLYGVYFVLILSIILTSSLKTNYLYYLPFAVVCASALKFSRLEARRLMSKNFR